METGKWTHLGSHRPESPGGAIAGTVEVRETTSATATASAAAGPVEITSTSTTVETTLVHRGEKSAGVESTTTTTTKQRRMAGSAATRPKRGLNWPLDAAEFLFGFAFFSWTGLSCVLAVLGIRFACLWQRCLTTCGADGWAAFRASLMLGTELGLFAMAVLIVLLVPRMIMTWTTTVVFEYVFGVIFSGRVKRGQVVADGERSAKEISRWALSDILEEGNAVVATVLLVGFAATMILRQSIAGD